MPWLMVWTSCYSSQSWKFKVMARRNWTEVLWESALLCIDTHLLGSFLPCHTKVMFTHEALHLSHPLKPVWSICPMTPLSTSSILTSTSPPNTHSSFSCEVMKRTPGVASPPEAQREIMQKDLVLVYLRVWGLASHRSPWLQHREGKYVAILAVKWENWLNPTLNSDFPSLWFKTCNHQACEANTALSFTRIGGFGHIWCIKCLKVLSFFHHIQNNS